jgi:Skp family chaperone for outer membrane proteins
MKKLSVVFLGLISLTSMPYAVHAAKITEIKVTYLLSDFPQTIGEDAKNQQKCFSTLKNDQKEITKLKNQYALAGYILDGETKPCNVSESPVFGVGVLIFARP